MSLRFFKKSALKRTDRTMYVYSVPPCTKFNSAGPTEYIRCISWGSVCTVWPGYGHMAECSFLSQFCTGNFCNSKRMVHFGVQFKEIEPDGYNFHCLRKYRHVGDSVLRCCSKRSWWWCCEVDTSSGFRQLLINVDVELSSCSDPWVERDTLWYVQVNC